MPLPPTAPRSLLPRLRLLLLKFSRCNFFFFHKLDTALYA